MKAAVVRSFDRSPRYEDFDLPAPSGEDEIVVKVLAAGLHPRVRSSASGTHYAEVPVLPMIPGIDAVGRLPDGQLVYCVVHDSQFGTMADSVVVDRRRCVPLPSNVDGLAVAAAMNPAMSSWNSLHFRAQIKKGQKVLVLGVTGNAGQMAVQVAKLLGAGQVIGAGRGVDRVKSLGADELVSLDGASSKEALAEAASDADIVLDYLWGEPAASAMVALLTAREQRSRPIDWVQIGSVAGPTMALPSVALRSTNLRVMGSGQGSISTKDIVGELPRIAEAITKGQITVDPVRVPLADVEATWTAPAPEGQRVVLVP
jgi:NADPH:quinone reductase-like Zn-dependent oxidoreductase